MERKLFANPACLKELLRNSNLGNRGNAVVLVLKFLLAPAKFVGGWVYGRFENDNPNKAGILRVAKFQ